MPGKPTILVVEDEPSLRCLVRKILERCDFDVFDAESGTAALEIWEKHKNRIDLLLSDMVMPDGLNGRQLAERLQGENPKLKVIFTTGYSAELVGQPIDLREGVNFLPKPYLPQTLVDIVRVALAST